MGKRSIPMQTSLTGGSVNNTTKLSVMSSIVVLIFAILRQTALARKALITIFGIVRTFKVY